LRREEVKAAWELAWTGGAPKAEDAASRVRFGGLEVERRRDLALRLREDEATAVVVEWR